MWTITLSPASGGQAGVTLHRPVCSHHTRALHHTLGHTLQSAVITLQLCYTLCSYVTQCYNMVIGYAMVTPVSAQVRLEARR